MIALCLVFAAFLGSPTAAVRVETHFMSLCHECQMHIASINNDIITGGNESSPAEAGVLRELELSVDYYGSIGPDGTCESGDMSPHGPQQCQIDRYHLCGQHMGGGATKGAAVKWWPFVHCMFMNLDFLKCGSNWFCNDTTQFSLVRDSIVGSCAAVTGVDHKALLECANGPLGRELQTASFNRTNSLNQSIGFAPQFIEGEFIDTTGMFWRKSPDQLTYGKTLLGEICPHLADQDVEALACEGVSSALPLKH